MMTLTVWSVTMLSLAAGLAVFVPVWVLRQREKNVRAAAVLIHSRRSDR